MPFFTWLRYTSRGANVRLPIVMNTKSVKCSIAFAATRVMLALKSIRNCSSSVPSEALVEPFPLLSPHRVLICVCMSLCTLNRHLLKLAVWLQTTEASLAVFSNLLKVSWDILRGAGGVDAKAAFLEILPKLLFSLE